MPTELCPLFQLTRVTFDPALPYLVLESLRDLPPQVNVTLASRKEYLGLSPILRLGHHEAAYTRHTSTLQWRRQPSGSG